MPKELVAIAVQQPVLQDYEEGPVPAGNIRHQSGLRCTQTGHRVDGVSWISRCVISNGLGKYVRRSGYRSRRRRRGALDRRSGRRIWKPPRDTHMERLNALCV